MGLVDALLEGGVSFVVQKLGDFTVGRVQELSEISHDIDWIKKELLMMKACLRDVDRRVETCEAFDEWEKQVKDATFMIEDFMDEYVYRESALTFGASGSSNMAWNAFNSQTAKKIQDIKNEVAAVSSRGQKYILHLNKVYGFANSIHDPWESSGRATHHVPLQSPNFCDEMDIIGIDEEVKKLKDWLFSEKEMHQHPILSIVGMGGSGKTTIAKRAYFLAKNHFDYHLWVTVSHYSLHDLRAFTKEIEYNFNSSKKTKMRDFRRRNTNHEQLQLAKDHQSLRDLLYHKRYVLFLDDISNIQFWNAIKDQLPCNGMGRIIFTSRQNITDHLIDEKCEIHTMRPLAYDLAWELFCRKAFQNYTPRGKCPRFLSKWCDEIVRRCCGLPLAIVIVGGLLCHRGNSERKWKEIVDHFGQELLNNPSLESLTRILQVSYDDLPSYLKYCFLYACLFPKQHKIKQNALIRLWVAQRFIKKQEGKTLEEVANDYFIQLIQRCLLQPIISDFTGELIACTVHSIMHDFATEKFSKEFGAINEKPCNGCEQKRYLAIHNITFNIPCEKQHNSARSLLSFSSNPSPCNNINSTVLSLRFLRVLCLEGLQIKELPEAVGELFHLTYLGLRKSGILKIPISLQRLYNLETFDIRDTRIMSMEIELGNFRKLTHALLQSMKIYSSNKLVETTIAIGGLTLLQTLLGVKVSSNTSIRDLRHLTQLRKLYVRMIGREKMCELFTSIGQIDKLCSLKIECCDDNGHFRKFAFDNELPLPLYLEKLVLGGVIMQLPQWFGLLRSLRVLVLVNSMLVCDPLSDLALLPNLVSLKLIHAYDGERMGCGPGGFPKLRHLHMASIDFEEWTRIEEDTMPCIQVLIIIDCCKLKMLPEGFANLKTLQTLEVIEMPDEFIERLMMEDKSKVQFIVNVTLHQITNDYTTSHSGATTNANIYRCFVGGLAWATNNSSLQHAFSPYGEILESKIILDRETGKSRGFGFVTFDNEQSMRNAIEGMNGQNVDGRRIKVEVAHQWPSRGRR